MIGVEENCCSGSAKGVEPSERLGSPASGGGSEAGTALPSGTGSRDGPTVEMSAAAGGGRGGDGGLPSRVVNQRHLPVGGGKHVSLFEVVLFFILA